MKIKMLLLAVFIMLSLFSWKAQACFAPDELFYYKGSQTISEFKNIFGPEYYGVHRFQKPPLFYLTVFLSFKLFGVNWFAARLPAIISGVLLILVIYLLALKMFDDKNKAFFAAALPATSIIFFRFGRIAIPEMTFVLFMTAAVYFAYRALTEKAKGFFYISFVLMGIGSLIKGPVAFIIPCLTIAAFSIIYPKNISFFKVPWLEGLIIIAVFSLSWLIPSSLIYGKAFSTHIIKGELVNRVVGNRSDTSLRAYLSGHIKRSVFYLGAIFSQYLPWSALAPLSLLVMRGKFEKRRLRAQRIFLSIWLLAGFLLFISITERRFHYVLTLLPAASLLFVSFFDFDRKDIKKIFAVIIGVTISAYIIAIAVLTPLIFIDGVDRLAIRLKDERGSENAPCAVSWRVDYQKVQLYIDRPAHMLSCPELAEWEFAEPAIKEFAASSNNSPSLFYAILGREEYDKYFKDFIAMAEKASGKRLSYREISADLRWRKKIRFVPFLRNLTKDPDNVKNYFKEAFLEEVLLVDVRQY